MSYRRYRNAVLAQACLCAILAVALSSSPLAAVSAEPPIDFKALLFIAPTAATAQELPDAAESTVGLAAPAGAVVLFDGSDFDAWKPFSFLKIEVVQFKLVLGHDLFEQGDCAMEITTSISCRP